MEFDFPNAQLLSVSQFMEKTEFRTKAMRAAKGRIKVEREKSKKVRTDVVDGTVTGEMFNPHLDQGGLHWVCVQGTHQSSNLPNQFGSGFGVF